MPANPFSTSHLIRDERGVYGNARRVRSGFLFRVIEMDQPFPCQVVYDGWWFRQKIEISGQIVWWQISWLTIRRKIEFKIPSNVDPQEPSAAIEIDFGPGLRIRRFRVWIAGQIVYDEIS